MGDAASPAPLTLEFALEAAAAGRLGRHPAIVARRSARARGTAEETLWLDTAEGSLGADGLLLEAPRRGPRRVVRTLPDRSLASVPGLPATLAPAPPALADVPVPLAAFMGRRTTVPLGADGLRAELRTGRLRAAAAEQPAARLLLTGPPSAVLELAGVLVGDLPLLPPRAALPEEGRALARGEAPRPSWSGAPDLGGATTVEAAFVAALGHLLGVALQQAPHCRAEAGPDGVHAMRVGLRRLRSVLRVFRPALGGAEVTAFDARASALARLLGAARDWDVFRAGLGAAVAAALPEDRRVAALLRAAESRRVAAYVALRRELEGPGLRRLMLDGLALLALRPWQAPESLALTESPEAAERRAAQAAPLPEFAASLLDRRWRRLRAEAREAAALDAAALHALRIRAKRLRYTAELFAPLWPGKAARRFLRRLGRAQDALGAANDAATARALVAWLAGAAPAWAIGATEGFAVAQLRDAREHAEKAAAKLTLAKPFWHGT